MKKFNKLTIAIFCLLFGQLYAQDGYTYTLVENGSYSFSIAAVPNTSTSNFSTSVQSYGFTIIVPDGVTITITSSFGNGASASFFNGEDVSQPTIDGYLIGEVLNSPLPLPAPSNGTVTPLFTFQVNDSPTNGSMYILANDSALANTVTSLKSYMQADMVDDAIVSYTNVVDSNASGLSGTTLFDFATLSVDKEELLGFSMYPNPTSDVLNLKTPAGDKINKLEVFDLLGRQVFVKNNSNNINVNSIPNGVYLLIIYSENGQLTKKFVKE